MGPLFVDGLGSVRVSNGMAHLELVTVSPPHGDGQQARAEVTQRLVMTLPHFVRFCAEMAGQLEAMEKQGLITRNKPAN
jgi:hypothetical protein